MNARIAITIAITIAATCPRLAAAEFTPPRLEGHLVDTSMTVTGLQRSSVDRRLDEFRRDTGYAIVVFVAGSLQGVSIEDAAYRTFNTWKVGDAGKDNGILIMIAPIERKIRIETGKGAGGTVTDLQANEIITKMGPAMKAYDLPRAIDIACSALEELVSKEVGPKSVAAPPKKSHVVPIVFASLFGACVLIAILSIVSRRFRTSVLPVFAAIGRVLLGLVHIISLFGGGKGDRSKSKYRGGGGESGGGGSSGGY